MHTFNYESIYTHAKKMQQQKYTFLNTCPDTQQGILHDAELVLISCTTTSGNCDQTKIATPDIPLEIFVSYGHSHTQGNIHAAIKPETYDGAPHILYPCLALVA
jgi:hypothetical protein